VALSAQNAPFAVWPDGRIAARSFSEIPYSLDRPCVANRTSSPIVVAFRLMGEAPIRGSLGFGAGGGSNAGRSSKVPTIRYRSSSTDVITRSALRLRSHHSLLPIPWPSVYAPVPIVACPGAVFVFA